MDTSLPIEGKDVQLTVTVDGAVAAVLDVDSFTVKAEEDMIESKPLGTADVWVDRVPTGWSGSLTVLYNMDGVDQLFDILETAQRTRVPAVVTLQENIRFRDLTTTSYTYSDVKLSGYNRNVKRGEAIKVELNWRSGLARIAM